MEKLYKSFELKAGENGIVEGYASTWTKTPDSYGDIVIKGAFTETLKKRKATGHPFPLCFNHDFGQIIGAVFEAYEDDYGLKVRASFLNTPAAQEKRELVKEGIHSSILLPPRKRENLLKRVSFGSSLLHIPFWVQNSPLRKRRNRAYSRNSQSWISMKYHWYPFLQIRPQ